MSTAAFQQPRTPAPMTRQQIVDLARAAHQAPSIHNTQPWLLRGHDMGLDVDEDASRRLPGTDPHGRERLISCGAAVRNAEIALARLGRVAETALLPDGPDAPRLAALRAGSPRTPSPQVEDLFRAIWERRTHRRIFMAAHPRDDLLPLCAAAVAPFGARLALVPPGRRETFARIVWSAAQRQARDDDARRELTQWTSPDRTTDGVPPHALGSAPFPVDGLLARTAATTEAPPPWVHQDLATGTFGILLVPQDGRLAWLQAGRALENLWLTLTAAGLVVSFLNQAVQQEEFRPLLAAVIGETGAPQMVLRIGEPLVSVPQTPRRPLTEVLSW
jgi:nitroreductase